MLLAAVQSPCSKRKLCTAGPYVLRERGYVTRTYGFEIDLFQDFRDENWFLAPRALFATCPDCPRLITNRNSKLLRRMTDSKSMLLGGRSMTRKSFLGYVVLPISTFGAYFACLQFAPHFAKNFLHTEHGAIEWGTATAFLIAACIAARLAWKTRGSAPGRYRIVYGLFAAAGIWVSLEEVSYGQKFFQWSSPGWFAKYNSKSETNLHNMFSNKPSNLLRALATIGCPVCCMVLPLAMREWQVALKPGSRTFYLLPQTELITMAALTIVLSVFNKIPSIRGMATWSGHLGEFKEFYWGVAAACYAAIISARLLRQKTISGSSADGCRAAMKSPAREAA
jgi:hypothetical protein